MRCWTLDAFLSYLEDFETGLFSADNPPNIEKSSLYCFFKQLASLTSCDPARLYCVIETKYVDANYTDEFSAYYSKLFRPLDKFCIRMHFMTISSSISEKQPRAIDIVENAEHYYGYVVFRPWVHFTDDADARLENLKIPRDKSSRAISSSVWWPQGLLNGKSGIMIPTKVKREVHYRGKTFDSVGVPFAQQDSKVGACAQTAIWVADRILHYNFRQKKHRVSQITEYAKEYHASGRMIPSPDDSENGLEPQQVLSALNRMETEPLFFSWPTELKFKQMGGLLDSMFQKRKRPDQSPGKTRTESNETEEPKGITHFREACKELWVTLFAYLRSGIPVIVGCREPDSDLPEYPELWPEHAVVAIGYAKGFSRACENPFLRDCSGLVIQDDQSGPYLRTKEVEFEDAEFSYVGFDRTYHVMYSFIPIPGKIYLTASEASQIVNSSERGFRDAPELNGAQIELERGKGELFYRLWVVRASEYLKSVHLSIENSQGPYPSVVFDKVKSLQLPRYIWVCEIGYLISPIGEQIFGSYILDATGEGEDAILFIHRGDTVACLGASGRMKMEEPNKEYFKLYTSLCPC